MANGAALKEPGKDKRFFTYADYKDWNPAETGRYEIIYGVAYAMAGPSAQHQSMLMELAKQIAVYLTGKPCKVYPAPYDVRLFYKDDESDDIVVQPDISIVCDEKKRGPEACRGAPDFVAEILSPSNTASEMERKFKLYRQAGVREYWVLDPGSKILHTHRFEGDQILSRFYNTGETAPIDILSGLKISLEPVFAE
jgi:Uma2 family endonuclease